jgi:hypothetical protein
MRARLIAIVFLIGCGDDGVDIDANKDNVCGEVAEVACHNLYQCCSEGEIEDFLRVGEPRTELECRDDVRRLCDRSIAQLDFAIDQKRLRFDGKTMNDCLDALVAPSGTCATVATELPWADACMNSAWVGLVDNGGTCFNTLECASKDSVCGVSQTCTAKPIAGQPCGASGCASGLFCSAGMCRAQGGPGISCGSSVQCLTGLFCDFNAAPSQCAPVRAPGEPCTSSDACMSARCNPGMCAGTTQTCFQDSNCGGRCEDDNSNCFQDSNCGIGACAISAATCTSQVQCTGVGDTCVFPVRCLGGDCIGEPLCADRQLVIDYCQDALGDLPVPN